jgi:predicted transcriptional regulator
MTDLMDKALERVRAWPTTRQNEAAELLLALDEMGPDPVDVDAETLAAIDEGLADIDAGRLADPAAIEAIFVRFRK